MIRLDARSAEALGIRRRSDRDQNLQRIDLVLDEVCTSRGMSVFRDYPFAQDLGRAWKFDRAIPQIRLALEYEGSAGYNSRHTSPAGFAEDAEKYGVGEILGWMVIRLAPKNLETQLGRLLIVSAVAARHALIQGGAPEARCAFVTSYRAFHERRTAARKLLKRAKPRRRP